MPNTVEVHRALRAALTLACCAWASLVLTPSSARAQHADGPQPTALPPAIAAPRDIPFAGTISLAVDATDVRHKIFTVAESIPVQASGALTLLYPAWEAGSHAKTASVADLAGLLVQAGGQRIEWRRDPVDMHAFHIEVPAGADTVDLTFAYLSHAADNLLRSRMVDLQWHRMLLYPAGWTARRIAVAATVTLPAGFRAFTSLDTDHVAGDTVAFKPTTLETLTDSPVLAGRYTRQVALTPDGVPPVRLDLLADRPADLEVTEEELGRLRAMVDQTRRLFGSTHYAHYDAIVTLSDVLSPGGGLEHLESGENNLPAAYFTDVQSQLGNRDLIAHEYVHSWNGRFRQPADLWTPTLNVPMRASLLWVYEGQTEFWGRVLAARSGLRSPEETRDKLALDAAIVATRKGRAWKTLADSNNDPLFVIGQTVAWRDWQRREDYYPEGVILWLGVEGVMRERSAGAHGLDDFARAFFGVHDGSRSTVTYTFDDVCAALDEIQPYDWAGFLGQWLHGHDANVTGSLARLGWRLTYTATPTETFRQDEADAGVTNLSYSIGLTVRDTGVVRAVAWEGPAFDAGLAPGTRIVAVNGRPYGAGALKAAVAASTSAPIVLAYEADGETVTARIDYWGPLRYPRLERIPDVPDRLSALLAAR